MDAAESPNPGEVQTCAGLGWLKLSRLGEAQAPTVRCVGVRASKQLAPAAGSQLNEPTRSATARRTRATEGATGSRDEPRSDETWALLCAGQLSMIMPPTTAAGLPLATAVMAGRTPQLEPPWAPCLVQCKGISACFEKVADSAVAGNAARDSAQPAREEVAAAGGFTLVAEADPMLRAALKGTSKVLRGAEAISSRASSILHWGATTDTLPSRLVTNTANMSKRICVQAGKIAKRSVEHVGLVATLPWRIVNGGAAGGDLGEGTETRPRGR